MSFEEDQELDELFREPELRHLAQRLHSVQHQMAEPDPAFRAALRRRLMSEAWDQMRPREPWYRRLLAPAGPKAPRRSLLSGPTLAGLAGAVGVFLIAFALLTTILSKPGSTTTVTASSPLQDAQAVALAQPIVINFDHPVDPQSVHVQIQPATQAKYDWGNGQKGSTLKITPVNGLAANTQYQVTVAPSTKSAGQAVSPKRVTFVTTTPPPTPTPTPRTSPTPTGTPVPPVVNARPLQPSAAARPSWSGDAGKLYVVGPAGQLVAVPLAGGDAQQLQPDGVTMVAVGPDGPAYVRGGLVIYGQVAVAGTKPIALGFRAGKVVVATADGVLAADGSRIAGFAEGAQAADFSPDGDHVAYLGATGLHVVDLNTQSDKVVGPAGGLGDWSPDGRRYAYITDSGVAVTDGSSTKTVATVSGVSGLSWSPVSGQLLLGGSSALQIVPADGSDGPRKLGDGAFMQPAWSPTGTTFSFRRSGAVWVAQLSADRSTPAAQNVDDAVKAFMTARKAQQQDQASSYLDSAGKAAFANLKLIYSDSPQLSRYYETYSQPNQAVVRLVLKQDGVETALVDETLALVTDQATGRVLVHGVTETAPRPVGKGPEVLTVSAQGNQVKVSFDSDLDPASSAAGVTLKGVSTTSTYDSSSRTVVLTVGSGLSSGTTYHLLVGAALKDLNQRPAAPFQVDMTPS
ncbi:MAG: Ig-like domain-containing protein [Candidatus Dormibacteraeota bacterium]|nr:Ig-like domain-containing protein [Candidatus Dormibacteraeota bacterium]